MPGLNGENTVRPAAVVVILVGEKVIIGDISCAGEKARVLQQQHAVRADLAGNREGIRSGSGAGQCKCALRFD